ncbi:autoinducer binding domain-containing protein [Roseibium sp. HPY-6]|uniref:helix-turn-helix transcriptional regulator n=1 Tax=Roseibium sp. HPY-6 TaxID=3229852 RepID=UPI00338EC4CD
MSDLEKAVLEIQAADSNESAFSAFNGAIQRYGYNNACYTLMTDHMSIDQPAFHGHATSYPEDWLKFYNEQNYQVIDAVWHRLLQSPTPFFWNAHVDHVVRDPEALGLAKKVMNEAEEAGVADGIGVSFVNLHGEIAGLGISRPENDGVLDPNVLSDIFFLSAIFHERYQGFFKNKPLPHLTSREKDVLCWAAEGKTDQEIGLILNVSKGTIRFHWNNIYKKLDVNSKLMATLVAIRLRLINPYSLTRY